MSVIALSNALIREKIAAAGFGTPADGKLHILGIRSASPEGESSLRLHAPQEDRYDDTILVFGTAFRLFRGSVDPGRYYTKKPLHPEGCAHLIDGGPYVFRLGIHKGHRALLQAEPFPFWRDADRDGTRDLPERTRRGMIGLNLHAGGLEIVGKHSAGCQVIAGGYNAEPWRAFITLVATSGQSEFDYFLIDGQAFSRSPAGPG